MKATGRKAPFISMKVLPKAALLLISAALPLSISPALAGYGSKAEPGQSSVSTKLPAIVAHRGGKRWAPENSMAAFSRSVEAGVDGIELDIHKCKSGELVVIHDDTLERTTNGKGYVKDKTWEELKDLDCGSWYDKSFKDERLPLLKDVLKLVDGKLTVNIEIKNCPMNYQGIAEDLLKLLSDYKYPDKIVISSFDHKVLKAIAAREKKYKLALLGDSVISDLGKYAATVGAKAWNPAFDCVRDDTVSDAHKNNLEVNTWTVNDSEGFARAVQLKVDAIITDDPIGLRKFLAAGSKQ